MRDHGWEDLIPRVFSFCAKHDIEVVDMDAIYVPRGRSKRFSSHKTNEHHFRVDVFLEIIDLQLPLIPSLLMISEKW